jgi:superfamily II DNA or RNA helicase
MGLTPTVIAPKYPQKINIVYLASVDTLRLREMPKVDLLIIDEAHKQTFDGTIRKYIELCNPYIIGATATPLRVGNQTPLDEFYQDIIEPVTTQELIDLGFLVPARTFASKQDFSDVKTAGNDYDQKALFNKFNQVKLYDDAVGNYLKFAKGKKAICFNVNVQHSLEMVQAFRNAGLKAEHIDGKTPDKERVEILKRFKTENFILCNCSVLCTGFDEPSIECVIVNRATMSLCLWLQMTGRGSRIYTIGGKENFIIIDQGANVYRHGLWEEKRNWSLQKKKKRKGDGVAPIKVCLSCESINYNSAKVCKECGEPFKVEEKVLTKAEFIEIKRSKLVMPDRKTCSRQELTDYAKAMGYKQGWVFQQLHLVKRM